VVDYAGIADLFAQTTFGDGSLDIPYDQQVVILVADDFVTPVATFSHGQYVYDVASQMLLTARDELKIPDEMIILDRVPVDYSDVSDIRQRIDDALTAYIQKGYARFVLNMSFNLVPCQYTVEAERWGIQGNPVLKWQDFKENYDNDNMREENYSLIQYVQTSLDVERDVALNIVYDWIGTYKGVVKDDAGEDQLDPLLAYLESGLPAGIDVLVPVASAGNYQVFYQSEYDANGNGLVDSFVPASWPEVIGVSSRTADGSQLSVFSNEGGISAPGEWHAIPNSGGEYVAGTSFAAPVVSVWTAVMESSTSAITCDFDPWKVDETSNTVLVDALWDTGISPSPACTP
jgi:hypothetical protein